MAWKIEFDQDVEKDLKKIDSQTQRRIFDYLRQRVATNPDPRTLGKPLRGKLSGLFRYRVGDYRIICQIDDQAVLVVVITIGHRKEIYCNPS